MMAVLRSLALAATLVAVTGLVRAEAQAKPTFVLVHGAWEDATIWSAVISRLDEAGFEAVAVNLPGRAPDTTPMQQVSLDLYRDKVIEAIDEVEAPVVLVGHSFGGMTISAVAEHAPEAVARLVYVAAYLPRDGQSLQDLAYSDAQSQVGPHFRVDEARLIAWIDPPARADLFLNDASTDLREGFAATMVDEPLIPLGTKVVLTNERFGAVPKSYIHTTRDIVVSRALQAQMVEGVSLAASAELDSGHAPFLTRPDDLASALIEVAK